MSNGQATGQNIIDVPAVARSTAALLTAVNASDIVGVMAVWSDDGVLMPPHHPSVHGRTDIERYFAQLFQGRRLHFVFISSRIQIAGDMAVEHVEYEASAWPTHGGPEIRDAGKGLHVYRRDVDGSWKLATDIWNSDRPVMTGS